MANPPAIVTSSLPLERLNQIATGKLASLGLRVRVDGESQNLRGELAFRSIQLTLPNTTAPLQAANFSVVGHDHLQFLAPPLSGLGRILFYDVPTVQALEERVATTLQQRLGALAVVNDRFKRLRIAARFESDALQMVGQVKTVSHLFELAGTGAGVWVSRIIPASGKPVVLHEPFHFVDLTKFEAIIDLELHLADIVGRLIEGAAAGRRLTPVATEAAAAPAVLEALPAPGAAPTLSMLAQHLGAGAAFGASKPSEITQDFKFKGVTWRFAATHVSGTTFKASLTSVQGEKWSDKFDLLRFPGIATVVGAVLGATPAPSEAKPAAAPTGPSPFPAHLKPQAGEVWVMNVLVEREDAGEVRYACTNIDGKPFGAARILKRAEFEDVFVQVGGGWRLLIVVEEIGSDYSVVYRQLDRNRQPRGPQKRMEGAILVTTFTPEAMAY